MFCKRTSSYVICVTILAVLLVLLIVIGVVIWLVVFETHKNSKDVQATNSTAASIAGSEEPIVFKSTIIESMISTTTTITPLETTTTTESTTTTTSTKKSSVDNLCRHGGIYLYETKKCICKDGTFGDVCENVLSCDELPEDSGDCEFLAEFLEPDVYAGTCPKKVYCSSKGV